VLDVNRILIALPIVLLLAGCSAQSTGTGLSAACDDAMKTTAAVPFDQSNAALFEKTLTACGSLAEWTAALQKYPAVGAVPEITDQEVPLYLQIVCSQLPDHGDSNSICIEAHDTGVLN
jgi:hypothetical protein